MTREPDATRYDPDPERLRGLVKATGMSQAKVANRIGVGVRSIERWLAGDGRPPYPALYCIEVLAGREADRWRELRGAVVHQPPPTVVFEPEPEPPSRKPHPLAAKLGLKP